ncbi:MAG: transglutaminase-like domain-containing protein [Nanoarchaeota archaeon]
MKKRVILIIFLILLIISLFFILNELDKCNDGTKDRECSSLKPFYCYKKELVKNPRDCEKIEDYKKFKKDKKETNFDYYLKGEKKSINITLYREVNNYLSNLSNSFDFKTNNNYSKKNIKLERINNGVQDYFINELVAEIINKGDSRENQLRIATSLVQNIPYNKTKNKIFFSGIKINSSQYPYEVLYNNKGVCQGKSELLALLSKKIGYETVIFYFREENHEAVGIKCPKRYSFKDTGYCIIETTSPSIISNSENIYEQGAKLSSQPEIIHISEGDSLGYKMYEYEDLEKLNKINNKIINNKLLNPFDRIYLNRLKEKYNLYYLYK